MGKVSGSKKRHTSNKKLANKSFNKLAKRQKNRKKEGKNRRGGALLPESNYISRNIERTSFSALSNNEELDGEITDEQLEALLKGGSLKSQETENIEGGKALRRKRQQQAGDTEDYEKLPRKVPKHYKIKEEKHLLPIKAKNGIIVQTRKVEEQDCIENDKDGVLEANEGDNSIAVPDMTPEEITMAQLLAERHHHFRNAKESIGEICKSILGDPQEKIGQLKTLVNMCSSSELPSVRKIAVLSACEVFKDIVPGYRIRALTDNEKSIKVSKDVKRLRDFEETLVSSYRKYLDTLEEITNDGIKATRKIKQGEDENNGLYMAQSRLGILSVKCMADLLSNLQHFNYRTNILAFLIPKMDLGATHSEIVNISFETVKNIFKNDIIGDVSLEIVKLISKYTKPRMKKAHPKLLDVLLYLNIDPELVKGAEQTENKIERLKKRREEIRKMSRMEKKRKKLEEKLNKELKETEAFESHSKIQKLHTEILKFVIVMYFRVIKIGRRTPLLGSALKGLSKYAYLINIDFFQDLFKSLETLMSAENLNAVESINCALTGLKILTGQGEALTIDPHQFYLHMYSVVLESSTAPEEDLKLCIECLELMLVKRRKQVSFQRMVGFLKRIVTTSLHLPTNASTAFLALAKSILQLNRRCDCLLDNDSVGKGLFRPELPDPEHCNAEGSALWELCLSAKHFCAAQREFSKHVLKGAPSQGAGSLNPQLQKRLSKWQDDTTELNYFFPPNIPKTKHVKSSNRKISIDNPELHALYDQAIAWTSEKENELE